MEQLATFYVEAALVFLLFMLVGINLKILFEAGVTWAESRQELRRKRRQHVAFLETSLRQLYAVKDECELPPETLRRTDDLIIRLTEELELYRKLVEEDTVGQEDNLR